MARNKKSVKQLNVDFYRTVRGPSVRRIYPLKMKLTLPEQKTWNIKKNGQVI